MKLLAAACCVLAWSAAGAQAGPAKRYRETSYGVGSAAPDVRTDTLRLGGRRQVSLRLVARRFYLYRLPATFFDKSKRGQEVTVWGNNLAHDFTRNWSNTYRYDQLGRLVRFAYSSCLTCGSPLYDYAVTYDGQGRPVRLENSWSERESYRFHYNQAGAVVWFEQYALGKLEKRVEFID